MEYVELILLVIGFLVIGYWQKHQIDALKYQIRSQDSLLDNTKKYLGLFSPDQFEAAIKAKEIQFEAEKAQFKAEKRQTIEKLRAELEASMEATRKEMATTVEEPADHALYLMEFVTELMPHVPKQSRSQILENAPNSILLPDLRHIAETVPYERYEKTAADREIQFVENLTAAILQNIARKKG